MGEVETLRNLARHYGLCPDRHPVIKQLLAALEARNGVSELRADSDAFDQRGESDQRFWREDASGLAEHGTHANYRSVVTPKSERN
jgi:hypothetical protein